MSGPLGSRSHYRSRSGRHKQLHTTLRKLSMLSYTLGIGLISTNYSQKRKTEDMLVSIEAGNGKDL